MFDPTPSARVFGVSLGVDFPKALVHGLRARMRNRPPHEMAQVELFVNSRRMLNRVRDLFDDEAGFVPRLRLITDLAQMSLDDTVPAAVAPLRRQLELHQLILALLEKEPDLAPKSAAFDLAESVAQLMDEMHGEGVNPAALETLDVQDMSEHWARSLRFLSLINPFFDPSAGHAPDVETRQRMVVSKIIEGWQVTPPQHPIVIAGSTGSRGTTALLMQAVANLPQGALILPGFDTDLPKQTWNDLDDALSAEDHPQYRFAALLKRLDLTRGDVQNWTDLPTIATERNKLISLALRPAPVTDQWQIEGRQFEGIAQATEGLTLIEAQKPRDEALAIAALLRRSVDDGISTALITPDRNLTRQVAAALDRWNIEPDDSAGRPLALSAPGRFLRQITVMMSEGPAADRLLALLKHPLTNTGGDARGNHLRWTRDLELQVLRGAASVPDREELTQWALKFEEEPDRAVWVDWVATICLAPPLGNDMPLTELLEHHLELARAIARGPSGDDTGELWNRAAGQMCHEIVSNLAENATFGGELSPLAYRDLFRSILSKGEVRDPNTPHPEVMFWGTLEARVQGADRVILAGLNDGVWPELPGPDPWLNRQMRLQAGLPLPERRVGLSAHDFQQAVASKEVILTRSVKDEDSETVPSRWLNRICNLMAGMSDAGEKALDDMRARGAKWLEFASTIDQPTETIASEKRPSPAPPASSRPRQLSATGVSKLIRDPFAVYADKVLHLRALDPLQRGSDALMRGTVLHDVFEKYVDSPPDDPDPTQEQVRLRDIADQVLADQVPNLATRILWKARIDRIAPWFVGQELQRRAFSRNQANEVWGRVRFEDPEFELVAKADRIDRHQNGSLLIYDYKTGSPPNEKQQKHFDKQLLLEAVIAEIGGFEDIDSASVSMVSYIGLTPQKEVATNLSSADIDTVKEELLSLISAYSDENQGYTSRRAMHMQRFAGDYDHLARFGEWDDSDTPMVTEVGR
ncbi:double-strand break repair protein AddB [Aliiroseovarius halocynthiae]|uniref:Double-strand break repair protein AddB n=1 Tax=Aliiroseovarius halocynthiae TaxID=985055 RepID=A0A545SNX7_9RHOB|nr:double-strand break repair protein AddB [Aliiroseovarius halocynthiae]TQV66566.1 double-strand break repair protein AddB [Aliiroseovarius halocynthiae]SMR82566.1 double-strand break repair protein AddB [Aliiroseovarius halocynthiae]